MCCELIALLKARLWPETLLRLLSACGIRRKFLSYVVQNCLFIRTSLCWPLRLVSSVSDGSLSGQLPPIAVPAAEVEILSFYSATELYIINFRFWSP
jgi:hypothetical protein